MTRALDLQEVLAVAVEAARAAGELQLLHQHVQIGHQHKSHFNDLVTEVDQVCEARIREVVLSHFPDHEILGEEGGTVGQSPCRWVVDPLDGTHNFVRGLPMSGVSIAFEHDGQTQVGVVLDPSRNQLFTAVRGGGAFLDGKRLQVSVYRSEVDPLAVATGFPRTPSTRTLALDHFKHLTEQGISVRRYSCAALTLAYVAAGFLDGYWDLKLQPWDTAAGVLLVEEAGGTVSDLQGLAYRPGGTMVASNASLHSRLLHWLQASTQQPAEPSLP